MQIIQGNVDTLDNVADLWEQMVKESRPNWKANRDVWKLMALGFMETGCYTQLLAVDEGKIVGFGDFVFFNEPSTGQLHSVGQHFYIKPEYRNSTAGFKLYRMWHKISKGFGATVMELFSFADNTDRWTKVGFVPARTLLRKEI